MRIGGPARGGTAWSRIAQIARQLLVETLQVEGQKPGQKRPHPFVPDTADFAAAIELQVEWELIQIRIDECRFHNAHERLKVLETRAGIIYARMNML